MHCSPNPLLIAHPPPNLSHASTVQPVPQSFGTSSLPGGQVVPAGFECAPCSPPSTPNHGIDRLGAGFVPSISKEQLLLLEIEGMEDQLRMLMELASNPASANTDCTFLFLSLQEARDKIRMLENELGTTKRYVPFSVADPPLLKKEPEPGAAAQSPATGIGFATHGLGITPATGDTKVPTTGLCHPRSVSADCLVEKEGLTPGQEPESVIAKGRTVVDEPVMITAASGSVKSHAKASKASGTAMIGVQNQGSARIIDLAKAGKQAPLAQAHRFVPTLIKKGSPVDKESAFTVSVLSFEKTEKNPPAQGTCVVKNPFVVLPSTEKRQKACFHCPPGKCPGGR